MSFASVKISQPKNKILFRQPQHFCLTQSRTGNKLAINFYSQYKRKKMSRKFTVDEVAHHNRADDCWIIVHGKVYDVTKFLADHPGGTSSLVLVP